jgi:hypothetical protein
MIVNLNPATQAASVKQAEVELSVKVSFKLSESSCPALPGPAAATGNAAVPP